jgi:hypothetical protein
MTITINGIECPIYFGTRAIKHFYESIKDELEADDLLDVDKIANVVYAGIENAAYKERIDMPVKFSEVYEEVDLMFYDPTKFPLLESIYKALAASQVVKTLSQGTEDVKKKKRSSGKKLKPSPSVS